MPVNSRLPVIDLQKEELQGSPLPHRNRQQDTAQGTVLQGHQYDGLGADSHVRLVPHTQEISRDAVLSNLDTLRCIPTVTNAVNNVLASY